jgi:hypothetical protein
VTVPVLLDLLLCHSRAWLPAAARRIPVLPHASSGIRDSSRAPDTRAGMTKKFDRADVRVTILCRTQLNRMQGDAPPVTMIALESAVWWNLPRLRGSFVMCVKVQN